MSAFPSHLAVETYRGQSRPTTWTAATADLIALRFNGKEWREMVSAMAAEADLGATANIPTGRGYAPSWQQIEPHVTSDLAEWFAKRAHKGVEALFVQMAGCADAAP